MVELEDNNGDVISCIVFLVDSLARENDSMVVIETLHEDGCPIFGSVGKEGQNKDMIGDYEPTSDEALAHLYVCNCDVGIELVFTNGDEESLLVSFTLGDMKEAHPWLNDKSTTKDMLDKAKEVGDDSPWMQTLKPAFKKRVGTNLGITLDSFGMTSN
mgnify:FL=1